MKFLLPLLPLPALLALDATFPLICSHVPRSHGARERTNLLIACSVPGVPHVPSAKECPEMRHTRTLRGEDADRRGVLCDEGEP